MNREDFDNYIKEMREELAGDLPKSAELEPVDWRQVWAGLDDVVDFLIEPVLFAEAQHQLYADTGVGKSLLVLEWAAAIATGRAVLGRPKCEPASVLVVDYENDLRRDILPRLEAYGYTSEDLDRLNWYSFPPIPPLDSAHGAARFEELIVRHRPVFAVLDSFARIVGGKENDADTYRAYYRNTGVVLKRHGVTSVRLDNTGKNPDAGARGSGAKGDDVDVVWHLVAREGGYELKLDKERGNVGATVKLRKVENPLRHQLVEETWPAGTAAAAELLDRLGVPLDASRRKARQVLVAAGESVSNEALGAGLRWRRKREKRSTDHSREGRTDSAEGQERTTPTPRTSTTDQSDGPPRTTTPGEQRTTLVSLKRHEWAAPEPDAQDNAIELLTFELGARVLTDEEVDEYEADARAWRADEFIAEWNADCDKADRINNPFRVNGSGALLVFRCPVCGKRFTDADEGHKHRDAHGVNDE